MSPDAMTLFSSLTSLVTVARWPARLLVARERVVPSTSSVMAVEIIQLL